MTVRLRSLVRPSSLVFVTYSTYAVSKDRSGTVPELYPPCRLSRPLVDLGFGRVYRCEGPLLIERLVPSLLYTIVTDTRSVFYTVLYVHVN
jgi:hypothetical protein